MASDLIYREDAKVFVRHACYKKINPIDYLDEVPAADVRPVVHGKWKFETGDSKTCVDGWVCSNCNCGFHTNVPYFEGFNFCPNCGADMREPNLDTTKGDNHD